MIANNNTIEGKILNKPQIFIKNIVFNDSTELNLEHNSIVVFTGANNSGKSQVLRDIELLVGSSKGSKGVILHSLDYESTGQINEPSFLTDNFHQTKEGNYQPLHSNTSFPSSTIGDYWKENYIHSELISLFVKRMDTELRLTVSNALLRSSSPEKHAIYKLNTNDTLSQQISVYFRNAFGFDLVLNRNDMKTLPLHVGSAPVKADFTMEKHDDYYKLITELPKLQEQGDGMRAFTSILLDTFTSEHTITLIDEPEAFLHPPQARLLGKMLAKNNPHERQLFISTHSEDFLQGLLDADNKNVTVIRINRDNSINKMSLLQNSQIRTLWSNPLLRYSNILSGLFHEKVVVCESDYDCLFYQAIIDSIFEAKNEIAPDILFTHCGGKTRMKDVINALRAVDVPVVAICDFDLINSKQIFKPIVEAFGANWDELLSVDMKTIYDSMNAKNSTTNDVWGQIKKIGKFGFTGNEPVAYERIDEICNSMGLFIIPVGEMECFDKTINKEKKDWVYHVLDNYDLAIETKLEGARTFIQMIVDYKMSGK